MKTLKKTLCLVLALVMLVGVLAIGASAADTTSTLTDIDKVQYTKAVGVMNGMGIIAGRDDGSFDPTASVNRAEAAKMVCYALIGQQAADGLRATTQIFPDVPKTAWYAPYVEYLVSLKVIAGFDDGNYHPTAAVTGLQLAKMLLVAAGYGQEGEYEGEGYAANTYIDALNKGYKSIFKDSKATDILADATREEAALYIYNAMIYINQVKYRPANIISASEYVGLGATMASQRYTYVPEDFQVDKNGAFVWLAATVPNMGVQEGYVTGNKTTNKFLAADTKLKNTDFNYYERTQVEAFPGGAIIAVPNDQFIFSSGLDLVGKKVKVHFNGTLASKDQKVFYVEDLSSACATITVKGTPADSFTKSELQKLGFKNTANVAAAPAGGYEFDIGAGVAAVNVLAGAGCWNVGAGKVVANNVLTLIANNDAGNLDTIVYSLGGQRLNKVTAYTAPSATNKGTITFAQPVTGAVVTYNIPKVGSTDSPDINLYDGIKKNDYVYVTLIDGSDNKPLVEPATVIEGAELTKMSSDAKTATIDGKTYKAVPAANIVQQLVCGVVPGVVSGGANVTALTTGSVSTVKKNFVLYSNGSVAGSTTYDAANSYGVILQVGISKKPTGSNLQAADASASIRLALADGTTAIYKLKLNAAEKAMTTETAIANSLTARFNVDFAVAGAYNANGPVGTIIKFASSGDTINDITESYVDNTTCAAGGATVATNSYGTFTKGSAVIGGAVGAAAGAGVYYTDNTKFVYCTDFVDYKTTVTTGYSNASSTTGAIHATIAVDGTKVVMAYIPAASTSNEKTAYMKSTTPGKTIVGTSDRDTYDVYIDGVKTTLVCSSTANVGTLQNRSIVKYDLTKDGELQSISTVTYGVAPANSTAMYGIIANAGDTDFILSNIAGTGNQTTINAKNATFLTIDKDGNPSAGGALVNGLRCIVYTKDTSGGGSVANVTYVYVVDSDYAGPAFWQ